MLPISYATVTSITLIMYQLYEQNNQNHWPLFISGIRIATEKKEIKKKCKLFFILFCNSSKSFWNTGWTEESSATAIKRNLHYPLDFCKCRNTERRAVSAKCWPGQQAAQLSQRPTICFSELCLWSLEWLARHPALSLKSSYWLKVIRGEHLECSLTTE